MIYSIGTKDGTYLVLDKVANTANVVKAFVDRRVSVITVDGNENEFFSTQNALSGPFADLLVSSKSSTGKKVPLVIVYNVNWATTMTKEMAHAYSSGLAKTFANSGYYIRLAIIGHHKYMTAHNSAMVKIVNESAREVRAFKTVGVVRTIRVFRYDPNFLQGFTYEPQNEKYSQAFGYQNVRNVGRFTTEVKRLFVAHVNKDYKELKNETDKTKYEGYLWSKIREKGYSPFSTDDISVIKRDSLDALSVIVKGKLDYDQTKEVLDNIAPALAAQFSLFRYGKDWEEVKKNNQQSQYFTIIAYPPTTIRPGEQIGEMSDIATFALDFKSAIGKVMHDERIEEVLLNNGFKPWNTQIDLTTDASTYANASQSRPKVHTNSENVSEQITEPSVLVKFAKKIPLEDAQGVVSTALMNMSDENENRKLYKIIVDTKPISNNDVYGSEEELKAAKEKLQKKDDRGCAQRKSRKSSQRKTRETREEGKAPKEKQNCSSIRARFRIA